MLKHGTELSPLRALQSALRTRAGAAAEGMGGAAAAPAGAAPPDPAPAVGKKLIQNLAASLGVGADEAAALLLSAEPDGLKGLSERAANELYRLKQANALAGEPEDYVNDESFLALLRELPPEAALRVYAAEKSAAQAQEALASAREDGARDLMEKLAARKALPVPLKQAALSAPETDYLGMSSEQFRALKSQLARAAQENRGTR